LKFTKINNAFNYPNSDSMTCIASLVGKVGTSSQSFWSSNKNVDGRRSV